MLDILRGSLCFTAFLIIHAAHASYSVSRILKDGRARKADLLGLWIAFGIVTGLLALIIWIFLRPQGELSSCSRCGKEFLKRIDTCPFCGKERGSREDVRVSRKRSVSGEDIWSVSDRKNKVNKEIKKVRDADHVWVHTSPTGTGIVDPNIKPKKRFKDPKRCPICGRETYEWEKRCSRCGNLIERD